MASVFAQSGPHVPDMKFLMALPRLALSCLVLVAFSLPGSLALSPARFPPGTRARAVQPPSTRSRTPSLASDSDVPAVDEEERRALERRLFDESFRNWGRPLENGYCVAAGALAGQAFAASTAVAARWVLGATAFALLCDFGPSSRRDLARSIAASEFATDEYLQAMPPMRLDQNNFVVNQGAPDLMARGRKEMASDKLAASHRWALLVRCRVVADVLGVALALSGRACLGAALALSGHTGFWAAGAAAARVDSRAEPRPISAPLAKIIETVAFSLTAAAALGAVGWSADLRDAAARVYAVTMLAVQLARLMADRVRARVHVGL